MKTITITERPDLTTSQLLDLCRAKFKVWSFYDDARLNKDFPAPQEATVRAFLDEQEPDRSTLGKSTEDADPKRTDITLRERILLELAYFKKHGSHLDVKGVTFCGGSRDSDGSVPRADWDGDEFGIGWYGLDNSHSGSGIRCAVSLDSSESLTLPKELIINGCKYVKE